MCNTLTRQLLTVQEKLDDKGYLESIIAYTAAPIIESGKPSSLFSFTQNKRKLYDLWDNYKTEYFTHSNIEYFEVSRNRNNTIVLFYNPEHLSAALLDRDNRTFLSQFGYSEEVSISKCLKILKDRFAVSCPHEVGIFLGIPLNDVIEFINNKGKNYLLNRYWKVYHNLGKAIETFDSYDSARIKVIEGIKNSNNPFPLLQ